MAGIDASLATGASIKGHVTDSQGRPVQGVNVSVNSTLMMRGGSGYATTNANGDYLVSGLAAGDYRVQFSAPMGSNLVSEYHPDTPDSSLAVPVKVAAGAMVTGIDASLASGASIAGHVTDSQGRPVQGVNVWVNPTLMIGGGSGNATTNANGDYLVSGLAAGDYRVQFSAPMGSNLVSEYHPDTPDYSMAVPVKVPAGATVTGIDASLSTGASITGHVTDNQGHPVQGVNVSPVRPRCRWRPAPRSRDANGDYVITGLSAGDFRVRFSPPIGSNLVSEYHPDTTDYSTAVPVKVAAGATVTGIDVSLSAGATVKGHVTDSDGRPVQGVNVSASSTAMLGGGFGNAITDANGDYMITGLAAGDFECRSRHR